MPAVETRAGAGGLGATGIAHSGREIPAQEHVRQGQPRECRTQTRSSPVGRDARRQRPVFEVLDRQPRYRHNDVLSAARGRSGTWKMLCDTIQNKYIYND